MMLSKIEKRIFLKTLDDVKAFVNVAMSKKYDIELLSGKYIVNAKSIMGVLSLDLTMPLTVVANVGVDHELEEELEPYIYLDEKTVR